MSATDESDFLAPFSNIGNPIDLSAPGTGIITVFGTAEYSLSSGTSHSAPIVSGVAGLVKSANPSLTGAQIIVILEQSVDKVGKGTVSGTRSCGNYNSKGWDPCYGYGE